MQAIMKTKRAEGLELGRASKPVPGPQDVLVRVLKTGICGTDRHIYEWDAWAAGRIKPPLIIGHEFYGLVEAVGADVHAVKAGDRVSGEGHIGCGRCYCCRTGQAHICGGVDILGVDIQGCFATYVGLPESNIWKVDDEIADDHACLFDPFGNAMHTVTAQTVFGKQVLVTGCGTIGLMAIGICREAGADRIIAVDPNPVKRKMAKDLGADAVLERAEERAVKDLTVRGGADVLLEMSGHPDAIANGFRCLRSGAEVSLLGIPPGEITIHWAEQIVFKGLTIHGINGRRMFATWYQCESFIRRHPTLMDSLITHRLRFDQIEEGIRAMQDGGACKVILDWTGAET